MDCAQEVSLLRARLSREPGVRELYFDTVIARMTVVFDPRRTGAANIGKAVGELGMECIDWESRALPSAELPPWKRSGFWTWISGLPLLAGFAVQWAQTGELWETLLAHGHHETGHGGDLHTIPAAALTLYAFAMGAGLWRIAPRAWVALRRLTPDMNLLVVASALGAAGLGEWVEAASLSFLFTMAGHLESWSLGRARESITGLLGVAPPTARVIHGDHEHDTPVERVPVDALVRVAAGERIPCDGTVEAGESWVDQALLTGESVAVPKGPGAAVYAGSLNEDAELLVRATRPSRDTVLARLIRMVESSGQRKARAEQWIERFARYYTPAVLALALTLFLLAPAVAALPWEQAAYAGMMALLVACPCALVISTPVTMMAAISSAARRGILIKGSVHLEEAARMRQLCSALPVETLIGLKLVSVPPDASREERHALAAAAVAQEPRTGYFGAQVDDLEALAAARPGISGAGPSSDAAQEAADIVLLQPGNNGLAFLVAHARRAARTLAVNIAIAIGFKLLFVAAALAGRGSLWMAVASDMGATLLVTLNGLRLLHPATMKK